VVHGKAVETRSVHELPAMFLGPIISGTIMKKHQANANVRGLEAILLVQQPYW